jgi:hypothetical protein
MFDPRERTSFEAYYGPFTVDACADPEGHNAQAPKFYHSQNSFLKANVEGENVWLNAPFRRAGHFLKHYLECKERAPAQTCAVIILPRWENKPWWRLTEGFRVLRVYPAGTHLFTAPTHPGAVIREDLGPTKWEVVVFWDPPTLQGGIKQLQGPTESFTTPEATADLGGLSSEKTPKNLTTLTTLKVACLAPRTVRALRVTEAGHPQQGG